MSEPASERGPDDFDFDVVVIGSGPGGYVAAIRAAQLGLRVACVERAELGGICLDWGCIPTKALLRSAEVLETIQRAQEFGILVEGTVRADFGAIIQRSRDVAANISKGVAFLLRKNTIAHVAGTGALGARSWHAHTIDVALTAGGARSLTAKDVTVATGARARSIPGVTLDGERIIDSRKAMTLHGASHPTFAEAIKEATEAALGHAIHL